MFAFIILILHVRKWRSSTSTKAVAGWDRIRELACSLVSRLERNSTLPPTAHAGLPSGGRDANKPRGSHWMLPESMQHHLAQTPPQEVQTFFKDASGNIAL